MPPFCGQRSICVTGTFSDLGVPEDLVRVLHANGVTTPFPIQSATLRDAIAGRDVCGRAPTGSGKTLAFAIPAIIRSEKAQPKRPRALVLVPTRELAAQVRDTIAPLARVRSRRVATVYGGTNIRTDQKLLRQGVDILVATPGRLADLIQRRDCNLGDVGLVILDEADRMADMGFLPEVRRLLDATSPRRQTLLFSATLDGDVDTLIRHYQTNPVRHAVAEEPEAEGDVRHMFWPADRDQRRSLTGDIVRRIGPAIVFTRTKHGADRLARQLATDGVTTAAIHGNRTQGQRERALAQFRDGKVAALVATDVAARGIHIDDVGVVVHFDLPGSDKDYIHRSGRTGRAGATGLVVTLVDDSQHKDRADIQKSVGLPIGMNAIDLEDFDGSFMADAPTRRSGGPNRSGPNRGGGRPRQPGAGRPRNGARTNSGGGKNRSGGGKTTGAGTNGGRYAKSGTSQTTSAGTSDGRRQGHQEGVKAANGGRGRPGATDGRNTADGGRAGGPSRARSSSSGRNGGRGRPGSTSGGRPGSTSRDSRNGSSRRGR